MHKPCEVHWIAAQTVLKYLKVTQTLGIKYSRVRDFHLTGYVDSDFDGDKENGFSTSSYLMTLGSAAISWRSKKQTIPADSTTEAKCVAAAQATKEIVWVRKILDDLRRNTQLKQLYLLIIILQYNWKRILNFMIEPSISIPNIT